MAIFAYTILYVKDVEASIDFYERAFGFNRKFISPDNSYGELLTGNTTLSFASVTLASKNLPGGFIESNPTDKPLGVEIAFATDEVQTLFDHAVNEGAIAVAEPITKPWGQVVAYVRDLEGYLVEICTPVES